MPMQALSGSRVRERRRALGLRQAELAAMAGISASYLNLIEHNRRRIGPELMARLAAGLGVTVEVLEGGAGAALAEDLRAAAAAEPAARAEIDAIEDLVGRFPGWAGLVVAQHRRAGRLTGAVEALNDRISHDPHLSAALHEVISAVTAVRSVSAILAETDDIDGEWRQRFHQSLHGDAERLAQGAEALVAYLDGSEAARDEAAASPQEEVEAWLAGRGWALAPDPALAAEIEALAASGARALARAIAAQAAADAALLPEAALTPALAELGPDPWRIAARFGTSPAPAMRRIALRPGSAAGLVACDASGTLVFRKPADGFAIPRFGAACALWPLYAALGQPMRPVAARVRVAGRGGRHFAVHAFCEPRWPGGFSGPELREAVMLILPDDRAGEAVEVGSTCRICPAAACPARREPTFLSGL
jgi:hypothetical protein